MNTVRIVTMEMERVTMDIKLSKATSYKQLLDGIIPYEGYSFEVNGIIYFVYKWGAHWNIKMLQKDKTLIEGAKTRQAALAAFEDLYKQWQIEGKA